VSAYPCAFEHAEFVAVADLPPQRQRVIREGDDHDPGLRALRDLAGGGAQDRGAGLLLRAGHAASSLGSRQTLAGPESVGRRQA
jgi:hypothetical protein